MRRNPYPAAPQSGPWTGGSGGVRLAAMTRAKTEEETEEPGPKVLAVVYLDLWERNVSAMVLTHPPASRPGPK